MKAKIKTTGEIVEVECVGISNKCHYEVYKVEDLDFDNLDTPDYWTRLEHQYAGMAMQGILSNQNIGADVAYIVSLADEVAHALVEKMKQEREG